MNKIEYGKEKYQWDYDPIENKVRVWNPEGKEIICWQDTLGQFHDPDYGDEEDQVLEMIANHEEV